jgi:chaperonin cofactor prefoldin
VSILDAGSELVAAIVAVIAVALFLQFSLKRMSEERSQSFDLERSTQPGDNSKEATTGDHAPSDIPTSNIPATVNELIVQLQILQNQLQTFTPHEVKIMADNALDKLNTALDDLSTILDEPAVKTALGAIPATIKTPIIEGLKKVLDVLKNTLKELSDKIASVVNLDKLFTTTTNLLDSAEGLVPDQKSTLEDVRKVVSTVQDVTQAKEKIAGILTKIDAIVGKLQAA